MKGQCGKKSFFGGQLPCPDNSVAQKPEEATRKKLIDICGNKWDYGAICCDSEQVCLLLERMPLYSLSLTPLDRRPEQQPQAR